MIDRPTFPAVKADTIRLRREDVLFWSDSIQCAGLLFLAHVCLCLLYYLAKMTMMQTHIGGGNRKKIKARTRNRKCSHRDNAGAVLRPYVSKVYFFNLYLYHTQQYIVQSQRKRNEPEKHVIKANIKINS